MHWLHDGVARSHCGMSDSLVIFFGHLEKSQLTRVFLLRQAWQPFDGLPQYTILNGGKELG
jgi:hypothetical protein